MNITLYFFSKELDCESMQVVIGKCEKTPMGLACQSLERFAIVDAMYPALGGTGYYLSSRLLYQHWNLMNNYQPKTQVQIDGFQLSHLNLAGLVFHDFRRQSQFPPFCQVIDIHYVTITIIVKAILLHQNSVQMLQLSKYV